MLDRASIRKRLLLLTPFVILLMSACTKAEATNPPETQTPQPDASATPAPFETSVSSPTHELTDQPQPDATATPTPFETLVSSPTQEPTDQPRSTATSLPNPRGRPDLSMALPVGDPERGRKLGLKYQCFVCHITNNSGPPFEETEENPSMAARVEGRLVDPVYSGFATTIEEYLLESIIDPEAYIVTGDWEFLMNTYDVDKYSEEDLADLIAWLLTLN